MNCPKCQTEIAAGVKFCPECGQKLGSTIGGDASLGGLKTVTEEVSLGQMPTLMNAAKSGAGSGQKISERYEILKEIGRGGFAVVWQAQDVKLGREVAIKRLQASALEGALGKQVLERFAREGQAIAALNHRNIVLVYDHDRDAEGAYVVMEYVGGGSLRELLKSKGGKLDVNEAVELVKGVARGLAYAHRKNLVHRDIKPANILLSKEGEELIPKIVDFGLARIGSESELSLSGMGMGTPWYMPPEQRRNAKGVNHTADLYALGKTLYELVTGEVPDTVEVEKLPAWLRPVVQRCIKNNAEERYFSADELLKDLEQPAAGEVTSAANAASLTTDQCPACGTVNGEAEKFCKKCGAGLDKPCPECGRDQRLNIRYCGGCGSDILGFENLVRHLESMRRYAQERRYDRLMKEAGLLEAIRFTAKGLKGGKLVEESANLKTAASQAIEALETELAAIENLRSSGKYEEGLVRLKAALKSAGTNASKTDEKLQSLWKPLKEDCAGAIEELQATGKIEEAIRRIEKLRQADVGWGESEAERKMQGSWNNVLENQVEGFLSEEKYAQAYAVLARLERLNGELSKPQLELQTRLVREWEASFDQEFGLSLAMGEYEKALERLMAMGWVSTAETKTKQWSEAFAGYLKKQGPSKAVKVSAFLKQKLPPPILKPSESINTSQSTSSPLPKQLNELEMKIIGWLEGLGWRKWMKKIEHQAMVWKIVWKVTYVFVFILVLCWLGGSYFIHRKHEQEAARSAEATKQEAARQNAIITTVAGNGKGEYSGDNGPAINAGINIEAPAGLAVDAAGSLYIADWSNERIRKVGPNGIITTVAGDGKNGAFGNDGENVPAVNANLIGPEFLALDAAGNLYILEQRSWQIRKVSPNGIISTVECTNTCHLTGLCLAAGNFYVSEEDNKQVLKISTDGTITPVAGNKVIENDTDIHGNKMSWTHGTYSGDNGPAINAGLNDPTSLALDAAGNLYIADSKNNRIRKVSPNGIITTVAGNGRWGYSGDNGLAIKAKIDVTYALALDAAGNLYIAEERNNRVRKVSPNGVITTVAGNGKEEYSGDNGPAINAGLNHPAGLALDTAGNLYIADCGNKRIRKVSQPRANVNQ